MNSPPVDFDSLSCDRFAAALCSGIHRVILEQEYLNRINVFPVADGDTGTNLSLSLGSSLNTIGSFSGGRVDSLLAATADALLDGARGNSGAIMAQFFQGLSDAMVGQGVFTNRSFSAAVSLGSEYAHDAIAKPQKGTILSVISAFADAVSSGIAKDDDRPFARVLEPAVVASAKALEKTKTQLEVLRRADVVDAGAKGFVVMLQGINDFLLHGQVTEKPDFVDSVSSELNFPTELDGELSYRYCTECMVAGTDIDRRKLREALAELGDSLVLAGTKSKAKIHVHVNSPEAVFEVARRYGTLSGEKADDMLAQHHSSHKNRANFAVITDSAADIADTDIERLDIHIVPMRIQFADGGYLDKISISAGEFFAKLENSSVAPTSSQPAPGDFRRQYQFLASHFKDVISVSLMRSVSGTLQSAQSAADRVTANGKIHVVDSFNASVGQGLLAVYAAECAAAGLTTQRTLDGLQSMIGVTRSYALVKDLSYAVRGGRVAKYVKYLADLLRVTPLLASTPDGYIKLCGILAGQKNPLPRFAKFIARRARHAANVRILIGHALCEDDARALESLLQQRLPNIEASSITELGAAFGVHGGPGTILVGVQAYLNPAELNQA